MGQGGNTKDLQIGFTQHDHKVQTLLKLQLGAVSNCLHIHLEKVQEQNRPSLDVELLFHQKSETHRFCHVREIVENIIHTLYS